ncbi:conserved hypothetical protein [Paraburkholderia piptadeniae]|uniref:DUF6884 domain-containing protein n=1 Tax=Paraburkholderia piptadeniae TaxID=1701573 RepID=A0A1N7RY98_9BURK|nr:DUF6884 domain-containing protein [Paraburkholderia piptadeniae]SIT40093.1 conserved hypothetical protein [Paraburkholderia piptadeniae]
MKTVVLVSCVKQKRDAPCPAKSLYTSDWFRKARAYAESFGPSWYILSAQYGLLEPGKVIAPYEKALNRMNVGDRRAWSSKVISQMQAAVPAADRIVILAESATVNS